MPRRGRRSRRRPDRRRSPIRSARGPATPAEHALRVAVPTRIDSPTSPFYDGRPDRISSLFAIAAEISPRLKIGAGLQVTPVLDTPTEVTYVAGRDKSIDKSVVIRLDRD